MNDAVDSIGKLAHALTEAPITDIVAGVGGEPVHSRWIAIDQAMIDRFARSPTTTTGCMWTPSARRSRRCGYRSPWVTVSRTVWPDVVSISSVWHGGRASSIWGSTKSRRRCVPSRSPCC